MNKIDNCIITFLEKKKCDNFLKKFIDDDNSEFALITSETIILILLLTLDIMHHCSILDAIFLGYVVSYVIGIVTFIKYIVNRIRTIIAFNKIKEDCKILVEQINSHKGILCTRMKLYEIDSRIDSYLSYSLNYKIGGITQAKAIINQIKLELSDLKITDKKSPEKLHNNICIICNNFITKKTFLDDLLECLE